MLEPNAAPPRPCCMPNSNSRPLRQQLNHPRGQAVQHTKLGPIAIQAGPGTFLSLFVHLSSSFVLPPLCSEHLQRWWGYGRGNFWCDMWMVGRVWHNMWNILCGKSEVGNVPCTNGCYIEEEYNPNPPQPHPSDAKLFSIDHRGKQTWDWTLIGKFGIHLVEQCVSKNYQMVDTAQSSAGCHSKYFFWLGAIEGSGDPHT